MEPKITLTAAGTEYNVQPRTFKNWADVMCSLTRSDFGGVVRKFTSQFEFTGETKGFLLGLYLRDGVEAQCVIAVYAANDAWEQVKEFECPLDFSTVSWDDYTLTISAVDSSLAAMIKADKGTKYEMEVGKDITPDTTFHFDRLPMMESATYAFTQGESDEDSSAITCRVEKDDLLWLGKTGEEISVGGAILYKDDQDPDDGGFMIEAEKETDVDFSWFVVWEKSVSRGAAVNIKLEVVGTSESHYLFSIGGSTPYINLGEYNSLAELESAYPASTDKVWNWATVGGIVHIVTYNPGYPNSAYWRDTGETVAGCSALRQTFQGSLTLHLMPGQQVRVVSDFNAQTYTYSEFKLVTSSLVFQWEATGDACDVASFTPKTVGDALLARIAADTCNAVADISQYDSRLRSTRVMAAESIRGIPGGKIYTSFSDYCGWLETVFGYTYWIGEPQKSAFTRVEQVGDTLYTPYEVLSQMYDGEVNTSDIVYIVQRGWFCYRCADDGKYYMRFKGWERYMTSSNRPLDDVVYKFGNAGLFYFSESPGEFDPSPKSYPFDESRIGLDTVTVHFVHRSELFEPTVSKTVENAKELTYSVNASQIYSAVEIGYEKKDYDSINGRDEFNFTNTYSTGSTVSDKKLTMQSKYRADCYGMEFAAQKRGADTTDTDSDQDVFFAYCAVSGATAVPDRTMAVEGALSGKVFNAEFSPMACVRANAGYIGMQSDALRLKFASSTGNSSVVIGGEGMGTDITLGSPLLTCGEVEFTTDDQEVTQNANNAVRVVSGGIEYVGFIEDFDLKLFRSEPAKYKLIVKSLRTL